MLSRSKISYKKNYVAVIAMFTVTTTVATAKMQLLSLQKVQILQYGSTVQYSTVEYSTRILAKQST